MINFGGVKKAVAVRLRDTGIFLLLLLCSVSAFADLRFQRLFTEAESAGQGVGGLRAMVQDSQGFIWLGGENGLARYDGVGLKRYQSNSAQPNTLLDSFVRDIQIDHDGVMWIATDVGISRYNIETDDFTAFVQTGDRGSTSHNMVLSLAVDAQNNLLIGTANGLMVFDAKRAHFDFYYPQPEEGEPSGINSIRDIFIDSKQRVWLGMTEYGLVKYDILTQTSKIYRHNPDDVNSLVRDSVRAIEEDDDGNLWIGTAGGGLSRLNPETGKFINYSHDEAKPNSIGSNTIWDIFRDSEGIMWVATDPGGLARYDKKSDSFQHFRHSAYNGDSLSSNTVRTIFEDRQHDLWFGMFPYGVNYYNRAITKFENYEHKPDDDNSLTNSAVLSMKEDRGGTVWIGTEGGLDSFDPEAKIFTRHNPRLGQPGGLKATPITSIAVDKNDDLWLGAWSGGLSHFDKKTGLFRNYYPDESRPGSLNSVSVWSLLIDKNDELWLGTENGGLSHYLRETERFIPYKHNPHNPESINGNYVWSILEDRSGNFWVGTDKGLVSFDRSTGKFTRHVDIANQKTENNGIIRVRVLAEDRRGRIWVGTQDDGAFIYDPKLNLFTYLDDARGMPSRHVPGMIEDDYRNFWLATGNGLARVNESTLAITVFHRGHGLVSDNFSRNAMLKDSRGYIYVGTSNGFSVFNPRSLNDAVDNFSVFITDFRIFNREVPIGKEHSPLKKSILTTDTITLEHSHSMFSFEFSALSYKLSARNHYAYKLEGFDKDWNYAGTERTATYTNLSPGKYEFKVKGMNGDGVWSKNIAKKTLIVLPPPWKTWWAFLFYLALAALFIYTVIRAKSKQMALENQQALNGELLRVNKIKDTFLANTSHELRTPLNGIIGIAESMTDNPVIRANDDLFHRLNLIVFSGKRLASLINDILDYSKLVDRKLEIFCTSVDLRELTENVFELLAPLSEAKHIELENAVDPSLPPLYADENRLLQIMINLVGNGIKYSDSGTVRVYCLDKDGHAEVVVEDSGVGIAEEQYQNVFEAFLQLESSDSRRYGGTGLGLSVSKQLVELHDGKIWVESELGVGSKFIFTMRFSEPGMKDFCHYEPQVPASDSNSSLTLGTEVSRPQAIPKPTGPKPPMPKRERRYTSASVDDVSMPPPPPNAEKYVILIVDDDPVNRLVLSGTLALHKYKVIEAKSGQEAIDVVSTGTHVDLIILDVMMPHLNGYDTCRMIREQHTMQELPIFFLTAKKVDEDIAKAFSAGGTEILTKPVSKYELLPRVANQLRMLEAYRETM